MTHDMVLTAKKHWSTIGMLAALLLVITGFAPAQAATARTLSLKASPTLAYAGAQVTFSGKVSRSPKGSVVKLQRKSGKTWVAAGSTRTSVAAGTWSLKVTLPTTAAANTYRALAPRTAKLAGVYSKAVTVTGLRRTTVTLAASPNPIGAGGSTTLSGKVSPFVAGTVVSIQTLAGSTWSTATTTKLSASGAYSTPVSPDVSTTYRAIVSRTGLNAGARSPSVGVGVGAGPVITTTSLPDAARGASYSTTLTKTGGAGTWSLQNTLPKGLSLNADTGVISGLTKGAPGTYAVYPVFTETDGGEQAAAAFALEVTGPALAITTPGTELPQGTKGVAYSTTLTKTGLAGTWSSLELPAGLTLGPSTGVLSGTPTVSGDYSVFVAWTETSTGEVATKGFLLHLENSPVITTTSLADAVTGTAYSKQLEKTGAAGTWTLKQGSLPPGITLSPAGLLSGTPTQVGDYGFTVTYTETGSGYFDNQPLLLHVEAPNSPHINTTELPDGQVGVAYQAVLSAVGTGTWSVVYQVPPPGITLNSATGALTGTPNTAGDFIFIVKFTTATGSNTKALLIHVDPADAEQ